MQTTMPEMFAYIGELSLCVRQLSRQVVTLNHNLVQLTEERDALALKLKQAERKPAGVEITTTRTQSEA